MGLGREEIKVCDAFWKQEMNNASSIRMGWELTIVQYYNTITVFFKYLYGFSVSRI